MRNTIPATLNKVMLACLEGSDHALALFDGADCLRYANRNFMELYQLDSCLGATFDSIMRRCHANRQGLLIDAPDIGAWIADVNSRRRQAPHRAFEADFCDGRWIWVNETLLADGWLYFSGTDITALKNSERAMRHARDSAELAANTDALTGLSNRRFILSALREAIAHHKGGGAPLSVCMMDLDYFKRINDTYGHQVGDRVLRHFADLSRAHLRPGDHFSRIGGEEFLLLLPGTPLSRAAPVITRLRRRLRAAPGFSDVPDLRYSFSAGLTCLRADDTEDSVIGRADNALYAAKQAGRDCHVVAQEPASGTA